MICFITRRNRPAEAYKNQSQQHFRGKPRTRNSRRRGAPRGRLGGLRSALSDNSRRSRPPRPKANSRGQSEPRRRPSKSFPTKAEKKFGRACGDVAANSTWLSFNWKIQKKRV